MATITEDYVSFETAKLLKEKGFDETCYACYEYFSSSITMYSGWPFEYKGEPVHNSKDIIKCPTLQMTMKWLRDVHNIFIDICTLSPLAYTYRVCLISDTTGCLYEDYACEEGERFMSYEEAVEFALDYCLNNIMEA